MNFANITQPKISELEVILSAAISHFTASTSRSTLSKIFAPESQPLRIFTTTDQNITLCLTNLIGALYDLDVPELSLALNNLPNLGLPHKYELLAHPPSATTATSSTSTPTSAGSKKTTKTAEPVTVLVPVPDGGMRSFSTGEPVIELCLMFF